MNKITIPHAIRFDRSLMPISLLIYDELSRLCEKGYTDISNAALSLLFDRDVRTISRAIHQLVQHGYITSVSTGRGRRIEIIQKLR